MEGTALGLNYGLNRMRELGIETREIRATGGGSRSEVWRQILADVFDAEVVCLKNEEGAALGAALQAMWAYLTGIGSEIGIEELCDRYAGLDESTRVRPRSAEAVVYKRMQRLHNQIANDLRGAFSQHRGLITN